MIKETSKLYRHLGAVKRSQRGIIARQTLKRLAKWELQQFVDTQLQNVLPEDRNIPIKEGGKIIGWL